ncbi:MAG: 4-(cytidine 5'-diphospho)-2-C-methyl-D-erythritol kinase [Planctomycetota bacterium]
MRPRRSDQPLTRFAPAKVNLSLQVLGKREDGFHELHTLMAPLSWGDRLRWTPVSAIPKATDRGEQEFSFRLHPPAACHDGFSEIGVEEDNLVTRAARLLADAAGVVAHGRIDLWKHTRPQAGLGGGSSDAAAALLLLNKAWGLGFTKPRLATLAARLGSDVPFFLAGSPAVCTGRGERVRAIGGLPALHLVVSQPHEGVPTADAFAELARQNGNGDPIEAEERTRRLLNALRAGRLRAFAERTVNSLQGAAAALVRSIGDTLDRLAWAGCVGQWMTGSGSACVGLAVNAAHARAIEGIMKAENNNNTFVTTTR